MSAEPHKRRGAYLIVQAFWSLLLIGGALEWVNCLYGDDSARAWQALLVNFVYFTPLACGLVVWPAVVMISHGRWDAGIRRPALRAVWFAPVSLCALALLVIGHSSWATWMDVDNLPNARWLDPKWLFSRDAAALAIVWTLGWFFARRIEKRPTVLAGWLTFAYCIAFTLLGMDLIMALEPRWFSALFGGYYFVSGMYTAIAAWTLLVILDFRHPAPKRLHDFGKLIVAFSLITTYLMFSQLLPIWYENLPKETLFVLPRLNITRWPLVSAALLGTIYLGPLVLLLSQWSKRSPRVLGAVACMVLAGMWVERWWLVAPSTGATVPAFGLPELSITIAFLAAFFLCVKPFGAARAKLSGADQS